MTFQVCIFLEVSVYFPDSIGMKKHTVIILVNLSWTGCI